ncbi:MAG: VOC family protein [Novosphingobium sp.]|nr:VOC family protein [Novosphingobium sp.]
MIRLVAIDHVVFRVRDMAAMIGWYGRVLGAHVEREVPDLGLVQLRAGESLIDFVDVAGSLGRKGGAAPGEGGRNVDHVCLRVEPWDGEAILAHLARHGVPIDGIASRSEAQGQGPSIYLSDPEGNLLELKGPPWPDAVKPA